MAIWNDKILGLSNKSLLLQASFWLFFISYEIVLAKVLGMEDAALTYFFHYLLYMALFYWHSYGLLIPTLTCPRPWWLALLLGLLAEMLVFYVSNVGMKMLINPAVLLKMSNRYSIGFITAVVYRFGLIICLITTLLLGLATIQQHKKICLMRQKQMEADGHKQRLEVSLLKSELAFLKAQIQPHFLFNALNQIYSQTRFISPTVGATIMQLCSLLRYHMVKNEQQQDSFLSEELDYLSHYINLQRAQHPLYLKLSVSSETYFLAKKTSFPAFILVTLLENLFNHGNLFEQRYPAMIHIQLKSQKLRIRIKNYTKSQAPTVVSGIGLCNIRKQLAHNYAGAFTLTTHQYRKLYGLKLYVSLDKNQNL